MSLEAWWCICIGSVQNGLRKKPRTIFLDNSLEDAFYCPQISYIWFFSSLLEPSGIGDCSWILVISSSQSSQVADKVFPVNMSVILIKGRSSSHLTISPSLLLKIRSRAMRCCCNCQPIFFTTGIVYWHSSSR